MAISAELIPYAYALRSGLPVSTRGIVFAVKDPFAVQWMARLHEPVLKVPLKRVLASPLDIDKYLVEFYAVARSVRLLKKRSRAAPTGCATRAADREPAVRGSVSAEDQHIVAIVDWLLQYAFDSRASDVSSGAASRKSSNVRFRIDGVLHDVYKFAPALVVPSWR